MLQSVCASVCLSHAASEMTYIVSSGALNSTPTNRLSHDRGSKHGAFQRSADYTQNTDDAGALNAADVCARSHCAVDHLCR